ncbi:hypothetical protein BH09MYX1_BH09MYX1_63850 [soil metagenome]
MLDPTVVCSAHAPCILAFTKANHLGELVFYLLPASSRVITAIAREVRGR